MEVEGEEGLFTGEPSCGLTPPGEEAELGLVIC